MPRRNRRVLHLTRNFRGFEHTDGFASTNVFEELLDRGWVGEVRFLFDEEKDLFIDKNPGLKMDVFNERDFHTLKPDLVLLEGGVNPLNWDDWRIPPTLLTEFVEAGGVAFAIDMGRGRLESSEQRKDARFFGAWIDPESRVPYLSDEIGSAFDIDPREMLVSEWLQDAFNGITSVHVEGAVPVQPVAHMSISSSPREVQLIDDVIQPGLGPFPIGTVVNRDKGFAAGIFAGMTVDLITNRYPSNVDWAVNLFEIVAEQASRRKKLLGGGVDTQAAATTDLPTLIASGESHIVEFKRSLGWNVPEPDLKNERAAKAHKEQLEQVVKTVAGFLNSDGGTLIVGVTDNGSVVGIEHDLDCHKGKDGLIRVATDRLANHLEGTMANVRIAVEEVDGVQIAVFRVKPSDRPVYARNLRGHHQGQEVFWVRNNNQTQSLEGSEAVKYIKDRFDSPW